MKLYGEYFCGNKISDYGIKNGFLDYATLAKAFNAVMNNSIIGKGQELGEWEQESGFLDEEEEAEVYQWFIVDCNGAEILKELDEIVYYHYDLDMYVWGVTHWGTSWDYVLTDVPCNVPISD